MSGEINIIDLCGKRILRQREESRNTSRNKANAIVRSAASHVPECVERPLMMPQGHDPYDVWHLILDKVTDPKEVRKLWNVCSFFREILRLKQKYVQTRLPQIFQIILDKRPWFLLDEEDVGPGNTLALLHSVNPSRQTLLNLRLMLEDGQNEPFVTNRGPQQSQHNNSDLEYVGLLVGFDYEFTCNFI